MPKVRQAPERWAKGKRDFLERFLKLPGGLPSRDCIRRLLIALEPQAFQKCFKRWLASYMEQTEDGQPRLIATRWQDQYGSSLQTTDQSHGRVDERSYAMIKLKQASPIKKAWPSVKAIGYAVRVSTVANQQETFQTRYFFLWPTADRIRV